MEGFMDWQKELLKREYAVREQFARRRTHPDSACIVPDSLHNDLHYYHTVVEKNLRGKTEFEDTALRYALRLKYPFLHHLTVLYPGNGQKN